MTAPQPYERHPGRMRTYAAEDRARLACPLPQLDGTQEAAQAYVDRITRSAWWRRTCPPSWMGDEVHRRAVLDESKPPRRVIVQVMPRGTRGLAHTNTVYLHRGRWFPRIRLGAAAPGRAVQGWTKAATDPWVVLHELAHIMVACGDPDGEARAHGREFRIAHLDLVRRWAGKDAAAALRAGYEAEGLRWRKPPGTRARPTG